MKKTLKEIVENTENIKSLLEVKLPAKVAYRLSRLGDKLQSILKTYDMERGKIIREYGEVGEDGSYRVTDPKNIEEAEGKLAELLSVEEEIDFEPIDIDSLGEVAVAPNQIIPWIFK